MGRSSVLGDYFSQGYQSVPHIIPGVLYPAVAGKLLDGSTSHSGDYGTAQSDSRKYYYTDIKGSKPIRDPRIGAHFGSQRHKFKSIQLLEQETALQGKNVYSVDGREWLRVVSGNTDWEISYDQWGQYINNITDCTGAFIEIVGFFNDINFISGVFTDRCDDVDVSVNGTLSVDGSTTLAGDSTISSPLGGRSVDAGSVINGGTTLSNSLGTTPNINTVRFEAKTGSSETLRPQGIELIAQDTTSTANKSKIQIPSQDVVSYGKKFTISGTPHYDPFNGFTDGTTTFSSVVDVDTSLGLGTATTWGAAWDKGSSNHIRPFNGGRVVKWIDSDGTIKTSVTMMPRNAQNIGTTASNEITTVNSTNSQTINFSDDAVEHSLSEVAKTYYWREFGNGAANGGSESGTYADASMVNTNSDDVAYCMDDGLTSLSANDITVTDNSGFNQLNPVADGDYSFITFIGTGITCTTEVWGAGKHTFAQNLPYGTHIVKIYRDGDANPVITVDGIDVEGSSNIGTYGIWEQVSFHQPKRPPIPEHACVIADYMLMADFVKQTGTGSDIRGQISKGSRYVSASRDHYYTASGAFDTTHSAIPHPEGQLGLKIRNSNGNSTGKLNFFGTTATFQVEGSNQGAVAVTLGGSATTETALDNTSTAHGDALTIAETVVLGLTNTEITWAQNYNLYATIVDSPTHTSHHYTPFETPFLHELIGGDRNMEQTHLICSQDGKTWDEITRDTSYLGNLVLQTVTDTSVASHSTDVINDEWRGYNNNNSDRNCFNKDFAIAYDRVICLVDGVYHITRGSFGSHEAHIKLNGSTVNKGDNGGSTSTHVSATIELKRGDYIQVAGQNYSGNINTNYFFITKV
tara:strand:- start:714 stop:3293 length:2580 start_codon:yes stop_codon:yes gene_type:complete